MTFEADSSPHSGSLLTLSFSTLVCLRCLSMIPWAEVTNIDGSVNKTIKGDSTVVFDRRAGAEVVTCYNIGTAIDRAPAASVIDDWCKYASTSKSFRRMHTHLYLAIMLLATLCRTDRLLR